MNDAQKLVRSTRKALNVTSKGKLGKLLEERKFWQRRQTIADNKLAAIQRDIALLANDMADKLLEKELP